MNWKTLIAWSSRYFLLSICLVFLFAGCNQEKLVKLVVPNEDDRIAQYYIGLLRDRDYDLIVSDLDPSLNIQDPQKELKKMADLLPNQQPIGTKIVGWHKFYSKKMGEDKTCTTDITYEYEYSDTWMLISFTSRKVGDNFTIVGFHINLISDSLENLNRFTLYGKSIMQYLVLTLCVIIPGYMLYWLVICVRAKNQKRKWAWIVFILLGFGQLSLNWTSGGYNISPFSIQFLGVSALAPLFSPWTFTISFPLGAVLYMLKHQGAKTNGDKPLESSPMPPPLT